MLIKRDVGKGQLCTRGGGGGGTRLGIFGGGSAARFFNPDPISDQNMPFIIRFFYAVVVPLKTLPDSRL